MSACGGTQSAGLAGETTAGLKTPSGKSGHTDPRKSCASQGIDATRVRTGACTDNGIQYVVGNYGGVVKLRTLGVAIVGVSVAPADEGGGKTMRPQRDAFLRVTLQVQNRDKVPHRFDFGQTMVGIANDNYLERTDVERAVHAESLARVNGGRIGPGETLRGDVLFDITAADYEQIQQHGRFFIWNFGHHAALRIPKSTGQVGQIRLYAIERS
jgi:hypothetical protein